MAKIKKPKIKKGTSPTNLLPPPNPPSTKVTHTQVAVRTAPLPHPSELAGYEDILPGAAERIFAMAESQAAHRQRFVCGM